MLQLYICEIFLVILVYFQGCNFSVANNQRDDNLFQLLSEFLENTIDQIFNILQVKMELLERPEIAQLLHDYKGLQDLCKNYIKIYEVIEKSSRIDKSYDNTNMNLLIDLNNAVKEVIIEEVRKTSKNLHNNTKLDLADNFDEDLFHLVTENNSNNISDNLMRNFINKVKDFQIKELVEVKKFANINLSRRKFTVDEELDLWEPVSEFQARIEDQILNTIKTRRIFKGTISKIKKYPFAVSIHVFYRCNCGGAILRSDLVITAASCLQLSYNNRFFRENPKAVSVRAGSNFCNEGGELIPVLEINFHPQYNPKTLQHNIAVVRLRKLLVFSTLQRKVKRIRIDDNMNKLPINTEAITLIGWGARDNVNNKQKMFLDRLSNAVLEIYPLEECREVYSSTYVTNTNFCAGFFSKGGGACNKDVGDPAVSNGILVGVVSFGPPNCGAVDSPTVFTKVGFYYKWIQTIINQTTVQQNVGYKRLTSTRRSLTLPKVAFSVQNATKPSHLIHLIPFMDQFLRQINNTTDLIEDILYNTVTSYTFDIFKPPTDYDINPYKNPLLNRSLIPIDLLLTSEEDHNDTHKVNVELSNTFPVNKNSSESFENDDDNRILKIFNNNKSSIINDIIPTLPPPNSSTAVPESLWQEKIKGIRENQNEIQSVEKINTSLKNIFSDSDRGLTIEEEMILKDTEGFVNKPEYSSD